MDDLVSYRIENAREKLESSKILLDAGHYKDSICISRNTQVS